MVDALKLREIIKSYRRLKKLDQISEGNLSEIEYSKFNFLFASQEDPELEEFKFNVQKFREVMAAGEHSQREIFQNLVPIIERFLQQKPVNPQLNEWRENLSKEVSGSARFDNGNVFLDSSSFLNLVKDRSYKLLGIDDGGSDFRVFERQRVKQLLDGYPELENLAITLNPENGNLVFRYRGSDGIKSEVKLFDSKGRFTFIPRENIIVRLCSPAPSLPDEPEIKEEIQSPKIIPMPRNKEPYRPSYPSWGLRQALIEGTAGLLERIFNGR